MGLLCFVYLIIALRTNIIFVLIFATLVPAFGCLAGVFFYAAQGITPRDCSTPQVVSTFTPPCWDGIVFFVQLLAAVDFH